MNKSSASSVVVYWVIYDEQMKPLWRKKKPFLLKGELLGAVLNVGVFGSNKAILLLIIRIQIYDPIK